jgi:hypothetical protein
LVICNDATAKRRRKGDPLSDRQYPSLTYNQNSSHTTISILQTQAYNGQYESKSNIKQPGPFSGMDWTRLHGPRHGREHPEALESHRRTKLALLEPHNIKRTRADRTGGCSLRERR